MKSINRIICLMLIAAFIIPFSGSVVSAKSGDVTVGDDTVQVAFIKGLGIIESYDAEADINAGDVANAINKLSNSDSMANIFFASYEYDRKVTVDELIKIFVNLAGYGKYASFKYGSAPDGGIAMTASEIGLLKGVSSDQEKNATMKDLVSISYNLLDTKMLKSTYTTDNSVSFEQTETKYINSALNAYILEGIVEAVTNTSLEPGKETRGNAVVINGTEYSCEKCEFEEYIGHNVRALIKNEDGTLCVKAMFDKSKSVEVDADDIIKSSTGKYSIAYYNANEKEITANISKRADVIYNYSVMPDYSADDFKISQGRLVLIDNNDDGIYEVVKIEEYKTMWLFSASVASKKIVDIYGNAESIEELIENDYPIYDTKGNLVVPENIPYEVVSTYYLNKNGEVVCIYSTKQKGGGEITDFKTGSNKVKIDGEEIGYSAQVKSEIEKLDKGTSIVYYLDRYGKIAYFEMGKAKYRYGYLVSFSEGEGFSNPKVKIFTEDDNFQIFDTPSTIILNDKKMSSEDAFKYNLSSGLWDEVGKKNQIVKYKANAKNVLKELYTVTSTKIEGSERPFKEMDDVLKYYSTPKTICANTRLGFHSKVFLVPEDLKYEKRFKYGTFTLLNNNQEYTCQVFDIDENRYAGVVLARVPNYSQPNIDEINGYIYIVDDVGRCTNIDGEESAYITAYTSDGNLREYIFNNDEITSSFGGVAKSVNDLKRGDVVSLGIDADLAEDVGDFRLWYANGLSAPFEERKQVWYSDASEKTFISDGSTYTYGSIVKLLKEGFLVNNRPLDNGDTPEERAKYDRIITTASNTPVFICDNTENKLRIASVSDICEGDNVFMQLNNALPIMIIIYR